MSKIDKTVSIFIGGKDRKMRFDINGILELEAYIPEKNIMTWMSQGSRFSFDTLIHAVWVGLKYEDKLLDLKKVRNWVAQYIQENEDGYVKLAGLVYGTIGLSGLTGGKASLFEDVIEKAKMIGADEDTDEKK